MNSSLSRARRIFFQAATVIILAVTVFQAWGFGSPKKEEAATTDPGEDLIAQYEEKIFFFQAKSIVGIVDMLRRQQRENPDQQVMMGELIDGIRAAMDGALAASEQAPLTAGRKPTLRLLMNQLILAAHLKLDQAKPKLCDKLPQTGGDETLEPLMSLLGRLCQEAPVAFTAEEQALLHEQLGWFGDLLSLTAATGSSGGPSEELRERVFAPAQSAFQSLAKGALIVFMLFASSAVLCTIGIGKLLLGTFNRRFEKAGMPSDYSLEVFCLYLCGMLLLSGAVKLLAKFGISVSILLFNIYGVLSLLLLIFWPLLAGQTLRSVRERLGLATGGIGKLFGDAIIGPVTYLASLVPIFLLLVVYSALLSKLNVAPGKGAHPIVPIITESKDPRTIIMVILTAVVVAPIVEEVMFRGAFYSWLRDRMGAFASVVISSMLFAALHPQGAVGLVPLTAIGIVLAFLREWRGTLIAPIFAHASFNAGTLYMVLLLFR